MDFCFCLFHPLCELPHISTSIVHDVYVASCTWLDGLHGSLVFRNGHAHCAMFGNKTMVGENALLFDRITDHVNY